MQRDVGQLSGKTFDVLVVGGGIYGLTVACDAASRGLSVALIERGDFGSGSSFNHLRTIHGGLRYLQSLDTRRARESIRERRTLARIAPHAVRPLAFALPLGRSLTRGRLAMRAAFLLDALISSDRNSGVAEALRLPAGTVVGRDEAIERFPALSRRELTGAAVWHDYVTVESDRLTFAWAMAAAAHGAVLANYVEATSLLSEGGRVGGVQAADRISTASLQIQARVTVNATGAGVGRLASSMPMPLLKAMNLVTRREAGAVALGGRSPSGRNLFLVPWRGRALFGTWESARLCGPDETGIGGEEVSSFIADVNHAFPSLDLTPADITLVHRGLVPAEVAVDGRVSLQGRDQVGDDVGGLVSVAGTKYTTARAVAERIVDRLLAKLGQEPVPCRTAVDRLPGGDLSSGAAAVSPVRRADDLPDDASAHLVAAYGSRAGDVVSIASQRADWRTRVSPESPVIGAQLIWAVRHEMAVTLADAVIRRTPLGALGYPGDAPLEHAAQIVGAELGWPEERRRSEIDAVRRFYVREC